MSSFFSRPPQRGQEKQRKKWEYWKGLGSPKSKGSLIIVGEEEIGSRRKRFCGVELFPISFSWGIYGVDIFLLIPWSLKKWLNALETNFPPLSNQNVLISCSNCVSMNALNPFNFSKQSLLEIITYNNTFFGEKYPTPPMDVVFIGPHIGMHNF